MRDGHGVEPSIELGSGRFRCLQTSASISLAIP
jgi:hypothetical protein